MATSPLSWLKLGALFVGSVVIGRATLQAPPVSRVSALAPTRTRSAPTIPNAAPPTQRPLPSAGGQPAYAGVSNGTEAQWGLTWLSIDPAPHRTQTVDLRELMPMFRVDSFPVAPSPFDPPRVGGVMRVLEFDGAGMLLKSGVICVSPRVIFAAADEPPQAPAQAPGK